MSEFLRRLRFLFRRGQFERDLEEEMRHHLAMKVEQPGAAPFGNLMLLREDSRAAWTWTFWEQLAQDVRYGLRAMAANKLFTAMAALSLALGIGANTAIYSFMDAVLLRALPVRQPGELVIVNWRARTFPDVVHSLYGGTNPEADGGVSSGNLSYPAYRLLRDADTSFTSLFAFSPAPRFNLTIHGHAELATGEFVSGGFCEGLGITPAAGRLIGPADDRPGADPVAFISHAWWQRRFASDPKVVGQQLQLDGRSFTIAGVAPPGFFGVRAEAAPELFIPLQLRTLFAAHPEKDRAERFLGKNFYWVEVMGRLRPGVTLQQAQARLAAPFHAFLASTAANPKERASLPALWLRPGASGIDALRRQFSRPLFVLMTMVGLILALACANIANLLLARSSARRREMAVRLSLGAGRLRIVRQLLTENLLLALCGGALSLFVAALGIRLLRWLLTSGRDGFVVAAALDARVLAFTLVVALSTGVLFGLAPALRATSIDVAPALKETRAAGPRARRHRLGPGRLLVVSQIAISLLLVVGAGLFVRTLANLRAVELGFDPDNILIFSLNAGQAGFTEPAMLRLYSDLRQRFQSLPGVRGATLSDVVLVGDSASSTVVAIPGLATPPGPPPRASVLRAGPAFFDTMRIPVLLGRAVDDRDTRGAPVAAVVNEIFAKRYFPDRNPLGRHFELGGPVGTHMEIVGVAKNARYNSLKREIPPLVYTSYLQPLQNWPVGRMFFELRTSGDPLALANTVRQLVHRASPGVPVADVSTQSTRIDQTIRLERIFAELCSCFAFLALAIACVGLYGAMAYAVARRTGEIGIRMALGAQRRDILWMVVREVLALTAAGLAIGMTAAWQAGHLLESFLFGLRPADPLALLTSAAVLVAAALLAGCAPAWRASRIDPMAALRHE